MKRYDCLLRRVFSISVDDIMRSRGKQLSAPRSDTLCCILCLHPQYCKRPHTMHSNSCEYQLTFQSMRMLLKRNGWDTTLRFFKSITIMIKQRCCGEAYVTQHT